MVINKLLKVQAGIYQNSNVKFNKILREHFTDINKQTYKKR